MPGRTYNAGNYRYGFGGHEMSNEIKGVGNSYTGEFWEYDPRIGRRWNIDPILKEYESPYAAFGNNPIWNIDPNGADTAKYLSNAQLVDAMKIGSNLIKKTIDEKKYHYYGDDVTATLKEQSQAYWKEHQDEMTFGAYAEFEKAVLNYHNGLASLAKWDGAEEFLKLERSVINNKNVNNYNTIVLSVGRIKESEARFWGVFNMSVSAALFVSTAGVGTSPGAGPKAPFSSNTQQAIVESQAGFKFTGTTIKRYVDPSRTVAATDLRRAVGGTRFTDPQGAAGTGAYYTTILRNRKSYNLKVIYNEETNTIFHFHYSRQAMGPLPKIKK